MNGHCARCWKERKRPMLEQCHCLTSKPARATAAKVYPVQSIGSYDETIVALW